MSIERLLADIERIEADKGKKRNLTEDAARQLGLTARAAAPAATGAAIGAALGAPLAGVGAAPGALAGAVAGTLAGPISDLVVSGYRTARDALVPPQRDPRGQAALKEDGPLPSQAFDQLLSRAGLPQPETATERVVQQGARGAIDAATGAMAARQVAGAIAAGRGGGPVTTGQGVAQALADRPNLQMAGGASGGVAGQTAAEAGAGPLTSSVAGMIGGVVPGLRPNNLFSDHTQAQTPSGANMRQMRAELEQAGVPLSPAQRLANPSAATFESVMRYLPTSARQVANMDEAQGRGFTGALMRQAGVQADNALPETLQAAQAQFASRYQTLERATMVQPDAQFGAELQQLRGDYTRGLDDGLYRAFDAQVRRLEQFVAARSQNATMAGENYHQIDGELRAAANQATRSDDPRIQEYGRAVTELRDRLQGLMERSAIRQQSTQIGNQQLSGRDLADAWRETNRQYAVFSRIKEAMGNATGRDKLQTGYVPPSAIAQTERASLGPDAYALSRDPFTRFVRAGASVLPDPVPNSGTAQRSWAQNMLTTPGMAVTGGQGALAAGGAAFSPIAGAAPIALPYLASRAWYAQPTSGNMLGLLAAQSLREGMPERP